MAKNERFAFGFEMKSQAGNEEAEILLYGYITQYKWNDDDPDMTAKEFDKLLKEAKKNGATKLRMRINSGGGSVWQAVAMRAMLANSGFEEINIDIEGLCASAATLFVCLPNVHVTIAQGSEFMIHNPSTGVWGTSADFEKTLERMRKTEEEQHTMYAKRTGQTEEQIKAWMDAETWFTASEAVQYGFADELLEMDDVAACTVSPETLNAMHSMYQRVPECVKQAEEVSNTEPSSGGEVSEHTSNPEENEEEEIMEIKDMTMDDLRSGNPELFKQIMEQGAANERERMTEIDDMTISGYEEMAQQAKQDGTDAVTFAKMLAKAQKQKGKNYLANREVETAAAEEVVGGDTADNDGANDDEEIQKFAKEMSAAESTSFTGMF